MKTNDTYITLKSSVLALNALDPDELALVERLRDQADKLADWNAFDNYRFAEVAAFYGARGLSPREAGKTIPCMIGQDLSGRLAIKAGWARLPDYRDDLEGIIRSKYASRKAFCEATGISESLLSHVLHRRKDLAIDTLEQALARIGYQLRIAPRAAPELAEQT